MKRCTFLKLVDQTHWNASKHASALTFYSLMQFILFHVLGKNKQAQVITVYEYKSHLQKGTTKTCLDFALCDNLPLECISSSNCHEMGTAEIVGQKAAECKLQYKNSYSLNVVSKLFFSAVICCKIRHYENYFYFFKFTFFWET